MIDEERILIHLDGWVITEESLEDDEYNKAVTKKEVNNFYEIAYTNAQSYLGYISKSIPEHLITFVEMWAAGLLYKKHDVRPNDLIDETMPMGYGDQLIINAKVGLKPYRQYTLTIF